MYEHPSCALFMVLNRMTLSPCGFNIAKHVLCEEEGPHQDFYPSTIGASRQRGTQRPKPTITAVNVSHVLCPSGHWTHTFLACDALSYCRGQAGSSSGRDAEANITSLCRSTLSLLFTCSRGVQRVPYSLVCDHSQDCQDDSDEDFCTYPPCSGSQQFECVNKQV